MFYDTLQKLAVRVVRLSHIKGILNENKQKISVLEKIGGLNPMLFEKQLEILNVKRDLQTYFEDMVETINSLSHKIELISRFRQKKHFL